MAPARCLEFAPSSQSFANVALPQYCSICSLSGLVSRRPSANSLEREIFPIEII
ncbi:hypothetical protein J6E39_04640 [bacterium]|nr:hypothetical protein [bacterium]